MGTGQVIYKINEGPVRVNARIYFWRIHVIMALCPVGGGTQTLGHEILTLFRVVTILPYQPHAYLVRLFYFSEPIFALQTGQREGKCHYRAKGCQSKVNPRPSG